MNEIATLLEIPCLAPGIDCHSWCPIHIGDAVLDQCAVCGLAAAAHPADAFDPDDEDADQ